ncbi:MAG: OmpA family protein [Polyangiaceae bacterium]
MALHPRRSLALSLALSAFCSSPSLFAETGASGSLSLSSSDGASAQGESSGGFLSSYPAEAGLFELGVFAGGIWVSHNHNLRDTTARHYTFDRPTLELGLRAGYFPLAFLGGELEGALGPTGKAGGDSATLWGARGQLVAQLPGYSVTPFLLLGMGRLGAFSDKLDNDGDPTFHMGGGVKVAFSDMLGVRLDYRDHLITQNPDTRSSKHAKAVNPELLLGLTLTFGRSPAPVAKEKPASDRDHDGFFDPDDRCPDKKGVAPDGCPIGDSDQDGFLDDVDKCPKEFGVAPDGCPIRDRDGDGILDPKDKCPEEKGVAPDGCPIKDTDGDGLFDDVDKCPKEPETKNGFEDDDGCPDKLPDAVQKFTGVIQGIEFDTGKATIRKKSFKTLDDAVAVLKEYSKVRIEISGHTDTVGKREKNVELSKARADSVKKYMTDKGIDASRIETRGAGPDEPIADNKTAAGKQKNRRIEFKLLQ